VLEEGGIAVNQPLHFPLGTGADHGAEIEVFRSEVFHIL
jgi:hypothetical protein